MPLLRFYVLALVLLVPAGLMCRETFKSRRATVALRLVNQALALEVAGLAQEQAQFEEESDAFPAKFASDALSEFFHTALEAGEVLGAGMRIEGLNVAAGAQSSAPEFQDLKHGVKVARAAVQATSTFEDGAPVLFSMIEEQVATLPVSVRRIEVRPLGAAVMLRLEVDVFGR